MLQESIKTEGINIELLLSMAFKDSMDGMLVVKEDGNIIAANAAISKILQYKEEELIGQNYSILVAKNDQQFDADNIKAIALGNSTPFGAGFEVSARRKDGYIIPIFLNFSKFIINEKKYYSGILHDLSKFKETQTALLKERSRLRKYLNVTNSIIVEIDRSGELLLFNKYATDILGYSSEEVLGKNWFELFLEPHLIQLFKKEWLGIFDGKQELLEFLAHPVVAKDGSTKIVKWHSAFNYDENDNPRSVLASGSDITQLMHTERELKLLNSRLEKEVQIRTNELVTVVNRLLNTNRKLDDEIDEREKAQLALEKSKKQLKLSLEKELELNQLKSRFLSMASHEFKTPISTVLSSITLLERYEEGSISEKKQKHFKRIKNALNHMTYMLDDFLSISKFEEGKISTSDEIININEFCFRTIENFQNNLKEGQTIRLQNPSENLLINTDPFLLKNILLNLLSNASKYSKENEVIIIRVKNLLDKTIFEVEDRGMGISKTDMNFLFTRFYRAGNVSHIKGTGLGLNIVRDYVSILKGDISVKSTLGKGSIFTIALPKNNGNEKDINH